MSRAWLVRLTVTALSISTVVDLSLGLPGLRRAWIGEAYTTLGLTVGVAILVFLASILALVLVWAAGNRPEASALALGLSSLSSVSGFFVGGLPGWLRSVEVPLFFHGLSAAVSGLGFVIAGPAFLRFLVLFPKTLTIEELGSWRQTEFSDLTNRIGRTLGLFLYLSRLEKRMEGWITRKRQDPIQTVLEDTELSWATFLVRFTEGYNPLLWACGAYFVWALLSFVGWSSVLGEPLSPILSGTGAGVLVLFFGGTMLWAIWGSFVLLPASYITGTEEERRRVLWVLAGLFGGFWIAFCFGVLDFLLSRLGLPEPLVIAADLSGSFLMCLSALTGLGIATFFGGAFDPKLTIRRTTVYGAIGTLFLFLFAGFGNVAEGFVENTVGLPGGVGSLLTGGALAVILIPVKRRMDSFMNRILPATVLAAAPTQCVAVLFSDIVGYTRLMSEDQNTALTVMTVFHRVGDRVARERRGRLVKSVADEVVMDFKGASDAVRAASELEGEFHEALEELDLPQPRLRTGIHYGEVTRSHDGDVFGDTVNLASKIHTSADPGQVVLSAAVKEQLKEGEFELESLGAKELKNVAEPVECFLLAE